MASTQDSIENCSICQNSRKKHYLVAPNNYQHIFGYLGPASKSNIRLSNSVKKYQYQPAYIKQSATGIHKVNYGKNLDTLKEKGKRWIQPETFLYCKNTKIKCDDCEADINNISFFRKKILKNKNQAPNIKPPTKKIQKYTADDECGPMEEIFSSVDSLAKHRYGKKHRPKLKLRSAKLDPEDIEMMYKKCKRRLKCKPDCSHGTVAAPYSHGMIAKCSHGMMSKCSVTMKNIKTCMQNIFYGSVDSMESVHKRRRRRDCSRDYDDEYDRRASRKKHKRRVSKYRKKKQSSTEGSCTSVFDSVESEDSYLDKKKKKRDKHFIPDEEDDLYIEDLCLFRGKKKRKKGRC